MTNVAVMNEEMAINNSIAAMQELVSDKAILAAQTMEEAYDAFSAHINIAKADFMRMVAIMNPLIQDVDASEDDHAKRELSMEEMDIVVGGNWFGDAWNKVKSVASTVKNKVTKTWESMPTWAKGVVIGVGVVAVVAAGVGIGVAVHGAVTASAAAAAHAAAVQAFMYTPFALL